MIKTTTIAVICGTTPKKLRNPKHLSKLIVKFDSAKKLFRWKLLINLREKWKKEVRFKKETKKLIKDNKNYGL